MGYGNEELMNLLLHWVGLFVCIFNPGTRLSFFGFLAANDFIVSVLFYYKDWEIPLWAVWMFLLSFVFATTIISFTGAMFSLRARCTTRYSEQRHLYRRDLFFMGGNLIAKRLFAKERHPESFFSMKFGHFHFCM